MNGEAPHPLAALLPTLPHQPGVYRFQDGQGRVLYVGKAKDLRKRVSSYFNRSLNNPRIQVMLLQAQGLELAITATENDALLLESNLIKQYKPRYNVLFKDDKSYPYLHISTNHRFPRLTVYRGDRQEPGRYFGPYPSATAVRETLKWLQRLFPIRQCEDADFASRERPCLQYQIKRCVAPCCGRVTEESYAVWIREVTLFLEGRDRQLTDQLKQAMWEMAEARRFEEAAAIRDRLTAIAQVREQRRFNLGQDENLDVVCLICKEEFCAIQVFFVRNGLNLGNRAFFPEHGEAVAHEAMMAAFLQQFYADKTPPGEILVNLVPEEREWLATVLGVQRKAKVVIRMPDRGEKKRLLTMAENNAQLAVERQLNGRATMRERLLSLAQLLELPTPPQRIEIYDVSHIQDSHPVASMVVCGPEGLQKGQYRTFALRDLNLPDDTARMAEVLTRRLERLKRGEGGDVPDLIVLDGGLGQLNAVLTVAAALGVTGIQFCAIAKGPDRNAGKEKLYLPGRPDSFSLPDHSPASFLLQVLRDEAHRFAIGFHRLRRSQAQTRSALDAIPGIGAKRKKALLQHFGSAASIRESDVNGLTGVEGISKELAERILRYLRESA